MPNKVFSVKFDIQGQQALVAATKQAGDAFDTLLAKSQKLATEAQAAAKKALGTADVAAYNRAVQQGEKAAVAANRAIAASYRELGVTSARSIEDQKQRAVAAYEAIKNSGVASAQDISQAYIALGKKLGELQGASVNKLGEAYKALGVVSVDSFQKQKQAAIEAFKAIRDSGLSTPKDIANAQLALADTIRKAYNDVYGAGIAKAKEAEQARLKAAKEAEQARLKAAKEAEQARLKAAKEASDKISNAYRELGVTSARSIEDQKQRAVAAYEAIKNSGVASARDISQAQTALSSKLRELNTGLAQTHQQTGRTAEGFTTLKGVVAGFIANLSASAVYSFQGALKALADNVIGLGFQFERQRASLKAFLGDANAANKLLKELEDFARTTIFTLAESTDAAQRLVAAQIPPEKVIETLKRLGAIAAGANKPLEQILFVYTQIANQGVALSQDINQFYNAGLSAKDFAAVLGVSTSQVKKLAAESQISFAVVEEVIRRATAEGGRFGQITAELAQTSAIRASNLRDEFEKVAKNIFEAVNPAIARMITLITDVIRPLGQNQEIFNAIKDITNEIVQYLDQNPGLAADLGKVLKDAVLTTVRAIGQLIKDWLKFYGENRKELEAIAKVLGTVFEWSYKIGSWWRDVMIGSFKAVLNTVKSIYDFLEKSFRVITQPLNPDSWFAQAQRGQPLNGPTTLPSDGTPLNLPPSPGVLRVPNVPIPGGRGTVPPPPPVYGPQLPASNLDRLGLRGLQVAQGAVVDGKVVPFLPSGRNIPGVTPGSFGVTPKPGAKPKVSPESQSRLRALQRAAGVLGVTVEDLVTLMLKESSGKNLPSNSQGGPYRGYYQIGDEFMAQMAKEGKLPGTSIRANDYSFEQQTEFLVRHALQPFRGFKPGQPGMDIRALYNAHNLGSVGARGTDSNGTPGGRSPDLLPGSPLRRQAQQYLAGLGDKGLSGFDAIQNDLKAQEAARKAQEKADKERADKAREIYQDRVDTVNKEQELAQKAEENVERLRDQADAAALSLKLQREQIGLKDADLDRAKAIGEAQKRLLEIEKEIKNLQRERTEVRTVAEVEQVDRLIQLRTQEKQVVQDNLRAELEGIAEVARQRAKEAADKKAQLAQDFAGRTGDYQVGALQTEAEILSRQGLEFEANALRQRAAILQENIRLQKELAEINREFATEPGMAAELERLARAQSQLNLAAMEGQFQTLGDAIRDVAENALGQLIEGLFTGELNFRNLALTAVKAIGQIAAKILTSQIIKLLGGLFGGLGGGGGLGSGFGLFSSSSPTLSGFGGGGLGTSFGGFLGGFATGGTVGGAIARERGLSRGRKVSLAAITHGEQVLSILSGEAQRYQSLQDTLGPNPLAALVGGYGGISIRAIDNPGGYAPTGSTAVSNWYIQTPDVASFNRSRQDILLAQAEETKRAQRRG